MLLEERTVYEKAIETWGIEAQAAKACEEFAELIRALARLTIAVKTKCPPDEYHDAYTNVQEEIADAEIMLAQLRMIFEGSNVDRFHAENLRRLARLLGLTKYPAPVCPPMTKDWSAQISE